VFESNYQNIHSMRTPTFSFVVVLLVLAACNQAPQKTSEEAGPAAASVSVIDSSKLNGAWQLRSIEGKKDSFSLLFPGKNPFLNFSLADKRVAGNTGCNSFGGEFTLEGAKLLFDKPMAMTKMYCMGNGENVFVASMQRVRSYKIVQDTTLQLVSGDTVIMSFDKSHTP